SGIWGFGTMLEQTLNKMADVILHVDEASLVSLWEKYRARMEQVDINTDWEKSVIIFFIINAVRAKNQMLNDHILGLQDRKSAPSKTPSKKKPCLRLIKQNN
ncbi:MAG: hypothetical protein PHN75_02620, partial [Syntrophales bacterium]|nr:hypothetical protein [Syntrophales bacterium]